MSTTHSIPSTPRRTSPPSDLLVTPVTSTINSLPPFSTTSIPRLQALYSDFSRQKQSNSTSYNANVDWWHKALESVVGSGLQVDVYENNFKKQTPLRNLRKEEDSENISMTATSCTSDRLVLHAGRELMDRIKIPKVGKPLSLGAVLSELGTTRSVVPLSEFLTQTTSIYNPGWLPTRIAKYVVGRPLWWALEQMGVVGEEGFLTGSGSGQQHKDTGWWGDYVMVRLVEAAADKVLEVQERKMASAGDALYTMDSFRATFAAVVYLNDAIDTEGIATTTSLRELDAKVLIKYLERDRGVLVQENDVIKFIDQFASAEERSISAVDRGIIELKNAIQKLTIQIDSLQSKIDECTRKASQALQQKRKAVALNYLRSRKQLEDLLHKRLGSLGTLESTFISVEAAAGDIKIMKSYESSTATLRAILAHPSLQRSSIDKTLDALADANADAREADEAVRFGGNLAVGMEDAIDDDELEAELKALVLEAERVNEQSEEERMQKKVAQRLESVQKAPIATPKDSVKRPVREGAFIS
ncbi:hypothetical protein JR316_0003188 [Psilocybe cubensis]|uniref:Snf7-domain-containing protein n=2 Tax=Psilocybe cubensis TaxID=181762 RepID=A0A8H8CLP9_PSICU|nr:hypothetical protein JR316_0003188 [Psilocybe cubensis]KAH9483712.1 hypothetical protein JR316_0003188 [Psilocybe cubensis]